MLANMAAIMTAHRLNPAQGVKPVILQQVTLFWMAAIFGAAVSGSLFVFVSDMY